MDLLVEIARLSILAASMVIWVHGGSYILYCIQDKEDFASCRYYHKRIIEAGLYIVVLSIILLLSGCTPRTGSAHQYHIAAITIDGVRTETDFLLTK